MWRTSDCTFGRREASKIRNSGEGRLEWGGPSTQCEWSPHKGEGNVGTKTKTYKKIQAAMERSLQAKESQGLSKLGGVWNSLTAFRRNDPAHTWLLIV